MAGPEPHGGCALTKIAAYAILREELFTRYPDTTVVKVMLNYEDALAEVARLNALNNKHGNYYHLQTTRLITNEPSAQQDFDANRSEGI